MASTTPELTAELTSQPNSTAAITEAPYPSADSVSAAEVLNPSIDSVNAAEVSNPSANSVSAAKTSGFSTDSSISEPPADYADYPEASNSTDPQVVSHSEPPAVAVRDKADVQAPAPAAARKNDAGATREHIANVGDPAEATAAPVVAPNDTGGLPAGSIVKPGDTVAEDKSVFSATQSVGDEASLPALDTAKPVEDEEGEEVSPVAETVADDGVADVDVVSNDAMPPGAVAEESAVFLAQQSTEGAANAWHEMLPELKLSGMAQQLAEHCLFKSQAAGKVILLLDQSGETLKTTRTEEALTEALHTHFAQAVTLEFEVVAGIGETPEKRRIRIRHERQLEAERAIADDPVLQTVQQKWGGVIVPGSVRPNRDVATS